MTTPNRHAEGGTHAKLRTPSGQTQLTRRIQKSLDEAVAKGNRHHVVSGNALLGTSTKSALRNPAFLGMMCRPVFVVSVSNAHDTAVCRPALQKQFVP